MLELVHFADVAAESSEVLGPINLHELIQVLLMDPLLRREYLVGGTGLSLRSSVIVTELIILKFIEQNLQAWTSIWKQWSNS